MAHEMSHGGHDTVPVGREWPPVGSGVADGVGAMVGAGVTSGVGVGVGADGGVGMGS